MDERERARARRRRKRRQQKSSVKWPRVILAIVVVLALVGGIGYGIYSGVSYAYRSRVLDAATYIIRSSRKKNIRASNYSDLSVVTLIILLHR